ncbi:helix-turn-helix transcriptional regulator [Bacillus sp. 3255]|uniref:response regulator transcription factor n=1 Tax=Bacillus sp. 3255 TaxID=2817904 RepID=UPI002854DCC9|nr:helix-turn-helix transcriptional regulator [Bacillus sp. 3255]MDR6879580.1 DNA-binding CsgD family transcriptional regulator [Bacillus sp. 3255]
MKDLLSRVQQKENDFLVGRDSETEQYLRFLKGETVDDKNIWNLFGTGGVGKSTLLDTMRRMSVRPDCVFLYLDSRDFHHTHDELCKRLLQQCPSPFLTQNKDGANPSESFISTIQELSQSARVTIAFDTYEEMDDLDTWLREQLIQWLPNQVLVVIAGRTPLKGHWQLSPAWRERVKRIPLGYFDRQKSFAYLRKCGISSLDQQKKMWSLTKGHPLALSLSVSAFSGNTDDWEDSGGEDWFDQLVELWFREVPDPDIRQWVESASVLRKFDQESLSFISGKSISSDMFTQLCRLSFVRKAARGWMLHDLMRDAVCKMLKERSPSRYKSLLVRCAAYYKSRINQSPRDGSVSWELGELFWYIGNATIRWILSPSAKGQYYWEPITEDNVIQGERYIRRRYAEALPVVRTEVDPVSDQIIEQKMDIHFDLSKLDSIHLRSYLDIDHEIVKLLRTNEGQIVGLSVIFPIHSETMPYLLADPLASPFFKSLTPSELEHFLVPAHRPAGWFIRIIDIANSEDATLTMEAISLLFSFMISGGFLIASPPPHPLFIQPHLDMGFQEVPNVKHCYYDGVTPTSTYVLDTRGNKLELLLEGLLQKSGMQDLAPADEETSQPDTQSTTLKEADFTDILTAREKEIVQLVVQGQSNAEIGANLFIAEVTVKKHLKSVYEKLRISNRTQLLRMYLTHGG